MVWVGSERAEAELVPAAGYEMQHDLRAPASIAATRCGAARAGLLALRATFTARCGSCAPSGPTLCSAAEGYVAGPAGVGPCCGASRWC